MTVSRGALGRTRRIGIPILVAIAALLSVAWSRLTEPVAQPRVGLGGAWATLALALPPSLPPSTWLQ